MIELDGDGNAIGTPLLDVGQKSENEPKEEVFQ